MVKLGLDQSLRRDPAASSSWKLAICPSPTLLQWQVVMLAGLLLAFALPPSLHPQMAIHKIVCTSSRCRSHWCVPVLSTVNGRRADNKQRWHQAHVPGPWLGRTVTCATGGQRTQHCGSWFLHPLLQGRTHGQNMPMEMPATCYALPARVFVV